MTVTQNKNPRLRFPEFREGWCLDEIKDYLEEYIERVPSSTDLPVLTSSRSGLFLQKDYFKDRELANEGEYGVLPYGYITYRHMSDDSTFIFNINYLVEKGVVSKEYPVFKTNGLDIYFLQQVLNHGKSFKRFATEQKKGGTRTRLYFKNLLRFRVHLPLLLEQQKIATFLSTIDTRIQQLSRKKALLEQYKKGVMQQIFSQEIRFKDEEGKEFPAWEEKRLGEIATFFSGGTPLTTKKSYYSGDIPFIKSGEINSDQTEQFLSEEGLKNSSAKMIEKGDLLYALYGATSGEVGIARISGAINQAVLCIKTKQETSFLFFFLSFMKSIIVKTYLQGGQGNLSAQIVKSLKVPLPSLPEQQKIAAFLSTIDRQINLVGQQLERVQTFKKGLLQQMFV